jgi:hypothetical protein
VSLCRGNFHGGTSVTFEWTELLDEPIIRGDSVNDAIRIAMLCWPDFEDVEGAVFLPWVVQDTVLSARLRQMLRDGEDPRRVEEQFNVLEVAILFPEVGGGTETAAERALANLLQEMWSAKLTQQYPERSFDVEASEWFTEGEWCVLFRHKAP